MVRVCGSTVSAMRVTRPWNVSPGYAASSTSMRSPDLDEADRLSGTSERHPHGAQIRDRHHGRVGVVAILARRHAHLQHLAGERRADCDLLAELAGLEPEHPQLRGRTAPAPPAPVLRAALACASAFSAVEHFFLRDRVVLEQSVARS